MVPHLKILCKKIGFLESDSKQRPYNAQLQLVHLNPQQIKEKIWNQKITDMYSGYDLNQGEFQRRHIILFSLHL